MQAWAVLCVMALMTAGGVWLADRFFRDRPWRVGVFFGLLAVLANTASVISVSEYSIALSLRDAPVIAAALFFGPLPGVIAGVIAAGERALMPLWGVGAATWCPFATFLVALIAAAVRRWFFAGQRPFIAQAAMFGIIFEMLHLAFDIFMGLSRLGRACEIVFSAFIPEAVFIALALALAAILVGHVGTLRQTFTSRANHLLYAYFFCCSVSVGCILICAENDSRQMVEGSVRRLDHIFESQIDFMLHHDAITIARRLGTLQKLSVNEVNDLLGDLDYDELDICATNGDVVAANGERFLNYSYSWTKTGRPYLELVKDTKSYYSEPFRQTEIDDRWAKFVGVPIPDLSGFIQLGYFRHRMEKEFDVFFFPLFRGFMSYFKSDYNLIASTNDWRVVLENGGHPEVLGKTVQELGIRPGAEHARLFGEQTHFGVKDVGPWRIYSVVPLVESYGEALVISSVIVVLLFVLVCSFRFVMIRFRRQQAKIDALRAEADAHQRADLEMARRIQESSLPAGFPSGEDFSFYARMTPAREVGGDFFDCFRLPDGRIAFTVADVSGKGVPAAMFMMKAKAVLKPAMFSYPDLAEAVVCVNDHLAPNNDAEMFVTAWIGVFDPASGRVSYVNAGHNPPLVKHADGSVEWIRGRCGLALAALPGARYVTSELVLAPGDSLLLYTDGVTEAQDIRGDFYGEPRLARLLASSGGRFVDEVFADVAAFAGAAEQADDITALALDRLGGKDGE